MDATIKEALDAALATIDKSTNGYLRNEDGERIGVFRWLPATEEEPEAIGGVRIDAVAIEEMAASLNERKTAIPIDGGPVPTEVRDGIASDVHGTAATGGGTPANGWAHAAVVYVGDDDVTELYLWAELFPSIAREVDSGRLAFGSVHFGFNEKDGELARDVTLISHALTNDPAVTTLSPANDIRARTLDVAHVAHRTRKNDMATTKTPTKRTAAKTTIRSHILKLAAVSALTEVKRGAALDRLTEVAKMLGVSIDDEMSGDSWNSPTSSAISSLKAAAQTEKVLEGLPASESTTEATEAAKSASTAGQAQRAEGDAPTAEPAAEAAAALDAMRLALDLPEATLAECIELLKANAEVIKDAIAAGPEADGESDNGTQEDVDGAAQASAPGSTEDAARSAKMDLHAYRSRVTTLETENAALRTENEGHRAVGLRARVKGEIDAALRTAGRVMNDDQIEELTGDLVGVKDDAARSRHLARAVGAGAPTGTVMGGGATQRSGATGSGAAPVTLKAAIAELMPEAQKAAKKNEARHVTHVRARKLAQKKYPHLAAAPASAEI